MKKIIISICCCVFFSTIYSQQNEKTKLQFYSVSVAPLSAYISSRDVGIALNIDLSVKINKQHFKLYIATGSEFAISFYGESIVDNFFEIDLLYGKEIKIAKALHIDLFTGLGYFVFNYNNGSSTDHYKKQTIGYPIHARFRYNTGVQFSLGLQFHNNINSATTIYQPGIFLQWNF